MTAAPTADGARRLVGAIAAGQEFGGAAGQLGREFGCGIAEKNLRRMIQFAAVFPMSTTPSAAGRTRNPVRRSPAYSGARGSFGNARTR